MAVTELEIDNAGVTAEGAAVLAKCLGAQPQVRGPA
jgi:hypothetical protein